MLSDLALLSKNLRVRERWLSKSYLTSHFFVIIQSGQKFTRPAISGIAPRKNHLAYSVAPSCMIPVRIKAIPISIRKTLQNDLIAFTFIILTLFKICEIITIYLKKNLLDYQVSLKYTQLLRFLILIKTNTLKSPSNIY